MDLATYINMCVYIYIYVYIYICIYVHMYIYALAHPIRLVCCFHLVCLSCDHLKHRTVGVYAFPTVADTVMSTDQIKQKT